MNIGTIGWYSWENEKRKMTMEWDVDKWFLILAASFWGLVLILGVYKLYRYRR